MKERWRGIDDNPISMDGTSWIIRLLRATQWRAGGGTNEYVSLSLSLSFSVLPLLMELLNSVFLDSRDSNREKIETVEKKRFTSDNVTLLEQFYVSQRKRRRKRV